MNGKFIIAKAMDPYNDISSMDLLNIFGGHFYVQEWFLAATNSKHYLQQICNIMMDPQQTLLAICSKHY
jgi:hypothetical protein